MRTDTDRIHTEHVVLYASWIVTMPRCYRHSRGHRQSSVCAGEDPRDETSRDDATSPPERDDSPLSDRIPETHSPPVVPDVLPDLRRSVRERKPPARLNDYVSEVYKT